MATFKAKCIDGYNDSDGSVYTVGKEYTFTTGYHNRSFLYSINDQGNMCCTDAAYFRESFAPGTRTDITTPALPTLGSLVWKTKKPEPPEKLKVTCLSCGNKPRVLEQEVYGEQVGVQSECCGHKETALFQLAQIKTINAQGGWTAFLSKGNS